MAEPKPEKKSLVEPLLILFIVICAGLIVFDIGTNLLYELHYAEEMKAATNAS